MPARFARVCLTLLLALSWAAPALALDLDGAKATRHVGERMDGYVGAVEASPSAEVKELVASVNEGRKKKYAEIARENGTSVEAVAALAGKKLVERAASGEAVYTSEGWVRKP